jgi:hypothetical protein
MRSVRTTLAFAFVVFPLLSCLPSVVAFAQGESTTRDLTVTGKVTIEGHEATYRIRNLPVSSFPDLPPAVAAVLDKRGCLIPQTFQAKRPENVIHASLERPGSADWAVLCYTHDARISLLVFFGSAPAESPATVSTALWIIRLAPHGSAGEYGFSWGIDPATPKQIHDAQAAMAHRPPQPDHDAIADTVINGRTVYHIYQGGSWTKVEVQ